MVTVLILTHNEEKHLERCINSLLPFTKNIYIVDSGSTDKTVLIAESLGAKVVFNPWITYATQFQYAIDTCPYETDWLMRMDADEYVLPELAQEIQNKLPSLSPTISGIYVKRRVIFMDKWIRYGGYYPVWLLRLWRHRKGHIEQLWMDEHIKVSEGETIRFEHDLADHTLNNLNWWTQKHNNYAVREAIDLLNIRYNFEETATMTPAFFGTQAQRVRFLKIKYASLPLFTRPFLYFLYRYILKFGFLDGRRGLIWHFLQGFWYRFLVDALLFQTQRQTGDDKNAIIQYFEKEYGKNLRSKG